MTDPVAPNPVQSSLERQIVQLGQLRNAGTRAQEFREWRQATLTIIERTWPDQPTRAQRFRRIPFSPASVKADDRVAREAFERGCAEARRLLQLWLAEVATRGVTQEAEAPRLAEAARATVVEQRPRPKPAPRPAAKTARRRKSALGEMLGFDTPAPESAAPAETPSEEPMPEEPMPEETFAEEPLPDEAPAEEAFDDEPFDDETPGEEEPDDLELVDEATAVATPAPETPAARPPAARPPAVRPPAARPPAARTPAARTPAPKAPAAKAASARASATKPPAAKAPAAKPPAAKAPQAKAPSQHVPAPPARHGSVPIEPLGADASSASDPGDTLAVSIDQAVERAKQESHEVVREQPAKAPKERGQAPLELPVVEDPHMVSYVARAFISMASDLEELGVPQGHRTRVRLALLDLAHHLDCGSVTWAIIRDAVTLVMHYPALGRLAMPLLLPYLESAA